MRPLHSIILLTREFFPFLPIKQNIYRGPLDDPLYQEDAPDGWWERNAQEHFSAVICISDMMRTMSHSNPNHYTPFSGLCIFTATLMNMYATRFPAMSRSSGESPEKLLSENMDDLERLSKLWKMGKDLLDVVGVMRNLYDLVEHHEARSASHSRDNYAGLESTMNFSHDHNIRTPELVAEASSQHKRNENLREARSVQPIPATNPSPRDQQELSRLANHHEDTGAPWNTTDVLSSFERDFINLPGIWPLSSEPFYTDSGNDISSLLFSYENI